MARASYSYYTVPRQFGRSQQPGIGLSGPLCTAAGLPHLIEDYFESVYFVLPAACSELLLLPAGYLVRYKRVCNITLGSLNSHAHY